EIELARPVRVPHRIAVGDRHVELELGMHVGKIRERHLQAARRNVLEQSNAPASATPAGAAAHMRLGLVVEREDPLREGQKGLAVRRHHDAARAAAEEGAIEDDFQSTNLLANRSLGALQDLGSAAHAARATAVTKQRKATVSTSLLISQSYGVPAKITSSLALPDRIALLRSRHPTSKAATCPTTRKRWRYAPPFC